MRYVMVLVAAFALPGMAMAGDEAAGHGAFWTAEVVWLAVAMCLTLVAMIALPIVSKLVDEQLGYFFFALGGLMLFIALKLGIVQYDSGDFVQMLMHGHREGLHTVLGEAWVLLLCYFSLSLLAALNKQRIEAVVKGWAERYSPATLVFWWVLVAGSLGSVSVVVMAVVGGIFFRTLRDVTKHDYTAAVVCYSACIGISALLTTIGEPLSLFMAKNLGEGTPYLLRTFGGIVAINSVVLAVIAWRMARVAPALPESTEEAMVREVAEAEAAATTGNGSGLAKEVREAAAAVGKFEEEEHDWKHEVDKLLHSTVKLYLFVLGLLLYGEAVKAIAANVFSTLPPYWSFWGNSVSAVADNALLGLLEVQPGMPQATVFILGISLALWGVGLVPGNVCNVVLKEALHISFKDWAKYGMPLALLLAALNFVLILLGAGYWLAF